MVSAPDWKCRWCKKKGFTSEQMIGQSYLDRVGACPKCADKERAFTKSLIKRAK
jgi:hypothetical protein